jgi:hypothetical protein
VPPGRTHFLPPPDRNRAEAKTGALYPPRDVVPYSPSDLDGLRRRIVLLQSALLDIGKAINGADLA